jgi:tRNA pseudouridine55 synthase
MALTEDFNGALIINKPVGPTSHDLVYRCRKILGRGTKVGHTGTLDPFASGVLVIVVGHATRISRYIQSSEKEYLAEVRLGQETNTYDREGQVVAEKPVPILTDKEIEGYLDNFRGPLEQIPPMFSAIRINGERLYKAARRNEIVERPPRNVEIFSLACLEKTETTLKLNIRCSTGTYIRSLAYDLGSEIGCGAHLSSLVRTRTGSFTLAESCTVEELAEDPENVLIPMKSLLPEIPALELNDYDAALISEGRPVTRSVEENGPEFRLLHQGKLISLAIYDGDTLLPKLVFNSKKSDS